MNSIDYGNRIKELAIRKVYGSSNAQIRGQFITETIIVTMLSASFSIVFYDIFRYYFKGLAHPLNSNILFLMILLLLFVNLINFLFSIQPSRTGIEKILKINQKISANFSIKSLVFIEQVLAITLFLIVVDIRNYTSLQDLIALAYPSLNLSYNALWMISSLFIINAIWGLYLLSQNELNHLSERICKKKDEGVPSMKIIGFFSKKNLLLLAGAILTSWLFILWINLNWLPDFTYKFIDWKTIILTGFISVLMLIIISGYHVFNILNKNSVS